MEYYEATIPFYKGTLRILGDEHVVTDINYANLLLEEVDGQGEVLKAKEQLNEYILGNRTAFDFNIELKGTPFQQAIYKTLQDVPYGETISYKQLAENAGYPNAARAVGQAMANNCLLLAVPCHRVIAFNGRLGGFTGGLDLKQFLLHLEKLD